MNNYHRINVVYTRGVDTGILCAKLSCDSNRCSLWHETVTRSDGDLSLLTRQVRDEMCSHWADNPIERVDSSEIARLTSRIQDSLFRVKNLATSINTYTGGPGTGTLRALYRSLGNWAGTAAADAAKLAELTKEAE